MIAIKRLQSIMWILIVATGALCAYLTSLRVATERNAVVALEHKIYATRANIRYLEVEFGARSTMRQLAAWNARDIKFSVPAAGQYLASEQQLASLDAIEPNGSAFAPPPVMAAMAQAEPASEPAVLATAVPPMVVPVKAQAPVRDDAPAFALVRTAAAAEPARARPAILVAPQKAGPAPRVVKLLDKADPANRRAMRLAVLEETLLGAKPLIHADKAESGKAAR